MLDIKITRGTPFMSSGPLPEHEVSGIIGLTGKAKGAAVVSLGKETALRCAERLLGERPPTIDSDVVELAHRLKGAGHHLTIETAGTLWKDVVCDLASVSPKLSNSTPWQRDGGRHAEAHERNRINPDTIIEAVDLISITP